jgi:hypothetical protein
MPDELRPAADSGCPFCGSAAQDTAGFCLSCELRWEEMECRQLRERLFGIVDAADPFFAT